MTRAIGLLVCICMAGACFAVDEGQEPSLKYTLTINGRAHECVPDTPLQLHGTYENPTIVLTTSPTRKFQYGGVEFLYPAAFGWEAEIEGPNDRTWTLSGNDFTIMYFVNPAALTSKSYAEAMVEQLGEDSTRLSDTERKLGGRTFKGKLLSCKLAGFDLHWEIYELPATTGGRLLVLQDSPPDGRARSVEGEKTLMMLGKTFKNTMTSSKADAGDRK